tara:strand:+ start:397 stop:879 length:483 start_codon:yes stop_codon:yes gene_type:complete
MKKTIVYPGTFDPLTFGHEDLISRASKIFDEVIVAVADSKNKKPRFDIADRVKMASEALDLVPNVKIETFDGLLIDFMRRTENIVLMRGIRNFADFEMESQLAVMNRELYSEVETLFFSPAKKYMFITASMVREIAEFGGDISEFVSPPVLKFFENEKKR